MATVLGNGIQREDIEETCMEFRMGDVIIKEELSPLIWLFSNMITSCPTAIHFDIESSALGYIAQDGFAHGRAAYVAYRILRKLH